MLVRRGLSLLALAIVASACNLSGPQVTLTLAPIKTSTPIATDRPEEPPRTPSALTTPTPAPTAAATSTEPARPAETLQPTPTRILISTELPSATPSAANTEAARLSQRLEPVTPTARELPVDESPSTTSPLPTVADTEAAELAATPEPRATIPPTWTAAPTLPPTKTLEAPLPNTATPWEQATAGSDENLVFTPLVSTPDSQIDVSDKPSPTPTPTIVQPTVAVRRDLLPPRIQPLPQVASFSISGASVYQYDVGAGQNFNFNNIQLGDGLRLFQQNPADPNSFLRTDHKGVLRYRPSGAPQEGEMTYSPFHAGYASQVTSFERNKNRIVELDWSADGSRFSFRIDTPPGLDNSSAGVWFWQPRLDSQYDPTYQLIRDCPEPDTRSCAMVDPSNAFHWKTIGVQWSPIPGNNNLLLTLQLPQEGRNALAIAQARRDPRNADKAPNFVHYDYGTWNPDGLGITVSGRRPNDGRVIIGEADQDLANERVVLDGSARGLWLRDAVRLPDGQYRALGRPGGPGSGPVALYDQNGNRLSDFIGSAAPDDSRWFPDRSAVLVSVQARQYTVAADGGLITDITGATTNPRFDASPVEADRPIPDAVKADSEFSPGEQLRIAVDYLNLRGEPSTGSAIQRSLVYGDYVAIFAGPYDNEGYRWWRVQTADETFGWLAGTINGAATLQRQL